MDLALTTCLDASAIALLSLVLLLFSFLFRSSKAAHRRNEAPLVRGAWPIIGHLSLLSGSQSPHITLGAMADKYGPLFTIKIGAIPALVISNWEIAKECFTVNDMAVSSRPKLVAVELLAYNQAMLGFAPYGPYWRELRKITTLEFFSNHRIQLLSHIRVSEVETSINELFKVWSSRKNDAGCVLLELNHWFNELTLNIILQIVAGKRFCNATGLATEKEARRCMKALRDFMHLMGQFTVGDAVPSLRWLDLGGYEKAMKETARELDNILGEWLEEHRQRRTLGKEVKSDEDFMDVMLSVLDGSAIAGIDADTITKATTLALVLGATDTSTVTLTWAISLLLNNPHTLRKAQEELDIHIGRERPLSEGDIDKLKYLQAIVKETLRLYPPGPLSAPREFTEDCTLGGYHIRKGTRLITNLWKIQTDPSIWSDPMEFKPERFLTTHKKVDVRGNHFELIPFGSGRRICPGISFGLQVIQLTLASFLQSFELSKPSEEPIDMSEAFGLTNMKATPLEVLIKPRLSSNLQGTV